MLNLPIVKPVLTFIGGVLAVHAPIQHELEHGAVALPETAGEERGAARLPHCGARHGESSHDESCVKSIYRIHPCMRRTFLPLN